MQDQKITVDLGSTTSIECKCTNKTFVEVLLLRKISRLYTGGTVDSILPIQVMQCTECGSILDDSVPTQVKELYKDDTLGLVD